MDSRVILVSTVDADGEHFFIMPPPDERELARAMAIVPKFVSAVEAKAWVKDRWQVYLQTHSALTEAEARRMLAEQGFDAGDVEKKIEKARRGREWAPKTSWDWLTQVGYVNVHGQTVVRKTNRFGATPFQRVFLLRCQTCGHEYEVEGSAIHATACPDCRGAA